MNILFLIGNGFDLMLGLATRFSDFLCYYASKNENCNEPYIRNFLNTFRKNPQDWSDFEREFGEYGRQFSAEDYGDYISLWSNLQQTLLGYMDEQQKKVLGIKIPREQMQRASRRLFYPQEILPPADRSEYSKFCSQIGGIPHPNVINFNYTQTFEKLFSWGKGGPSLPSLYTSVGPVKHIHGSTKGNMILGVDNDSQLGLPEAVIQYPKIQKRLIKPVANRNTRTSRDAICSKLISEANLIVIFGMSLGVTDLTWWKQVAARLKSSDARLVICLRDNSIVLGQEYLAVELQEDGIRRFLDLAGVSDQDRSEIASRIKVVFNANLFEDFEDLANKTL